MIDGRAWVDDGDMLRGPVEGGERSGGQTCRLDSFDGQSRFNETHARLVGSGRWALESSTIERLKRQSPDGQVALEASLVRIPQRQRTYVDRTLIINDTITISFSTISKKKKSAHDH